MISCGGGNICLYYIIGLFVGLNCYVVVWCCVVWLMRWEVGVDLGLSGGGKVR